MKYVTTLNFQTGIFLTSYEKQTEVSKKKSKLLCLIEFPKKYLEPLLAPD